MKTFFRKLRLRLALLQLDREKAIAEDKLADSEIGYGELAERLLDIEKRRAAVQRELEGAEVKLLAVVVVALSIALLFVVAFATDYAGVRKVPGGIVGWFGSSWGVWE
jgi:hypothetical protein